MRKKIIGFFMLIIVCIFPTNVSATYNAPIESISTWEIVDDSMDAFAILNEGSKIKVIVNDVTKSSISVSITTYPKESIIDPFIRYDNNNELIPFFISSNYLNENNENVINYYQENWFGENRWIYVISFKHILLQDSLYADWELYYDNDTGIMVNWILRDIHGIESQVKLINTDAWGISEIIKNNDLIWWIIGGILGSISIIIGFYLIIKKKEKSKINTMELSKSDKSSILIKIPKKKKYN